jgi:uncharacterized alpha-E superfamily protein
MLSRVADSLYWMSRYFERADNASRVLKATYSLILNPAKFSTEERWFRAVSSLAPGAAASNVDPQRALYLLVADPEGDFSIVKCISGARENARQVREEISSEMWEHLNTLFHDVTGFELQPDDDAGAMRVVSLVREGSYRFNGITAATLNHDEAWHFIQLGKYIERACNLCVLLDAYFVVDKHADDLDWVGLLSSCAAFEAYCKACTAELKPERIANFLLFGPLFAGLHARGFDSHQRPFFEPQDREGGKIDRALAVDGRLCTGWRNHCWITRVSWGNHRPMSRTACGSSRAIYRISD